MVDFVSKHLGIADDAKLRKHITAYTTQLIAYRRHVAKNGPKRNAYAADAIRLGGELGKLMNK